MGAWARRGAWLAGGALALSVGVAAWRFRDLAVLLDPAAPDVSLEAVEKAVARLWAVPQIEPGQLARRLAGDDPPRVFDVREMDEFDQAHIAGAVRVDPGLSGREFLAAHAAAAVSQAVFVCAVGARSSRLLARIRLAWPGETPPEFANLRGGMFRWAAQARPMVDAVGRPAAALHPYGPPWDALLARTLAAG